MTLGTGPDAGVVPADARPETLVLAADASEQRWVLRRTLERTGSFEVVAEVLDGFGCLSAARDQAPDAVLVDLDLPRTSVPTLIETVSRTATSRLSRTRTPTGWPSCGCSPRRGQRSRRGPGEPGRP